MGRAAQRRRPIRLAYSRDEALVNRRLASIASGWLANAIRTSYRQARTLGASYPQTQIAAIDVNFRTFALLYIQMAISSGILSSRRFLRRGGIENDADGDIMSAQEIFSALGFVSADELKRLNPYQDTKYDFKKLYERTESETNKYLAALAGISASALLPYYNKSGEILSTLPQYISKLPAMSLETAQRKQEQGFSDFQAADFAARFAQRKVDENCAGLAHKAMVALCGAALVLAGRRDVTWRWNDVGQTPRADHKRANGEKFDISRGKFFHKTGWTYPGQLPYCHCTYEIDGR